MSFPNEVQEKALKSIPGVDRLLELARKETTLPDQTPKSILVHAIRETLEAVRSRILTLSAPEDAPPDLSEEALLGQVLERVGRALAPNLRRVINATGVVVHTNLGRSLLAKAAIDHMGTIAGGYSNLEYDLDRGARGSRYSAVEALLCELCGAPAAMVVNNNAAAVLLSLNTVARGRQVVVSRGELVEIGGAFRIPDVMAKSGAILKEVGTTNRTHLRDYESAIGPETGLLLKVHTSNFNVVGFTAAVALKDLAALGRIHRIPVMEDLGSGTFIDFSKVGLPGREPTIRESMAAGADLVTFSGDKLLGGPQAGIILGSKPVIEAIRQNSLTRALRIDKLTLAALEATLRLYRDERMALSDIPTLRMLTQPLGQIEARARVLAGSLEALNVPRLTVSLLPGSSKAGGGALPLMELPTVCVGIRVDGLTAQTLEKRMRRQKPPLIGRIEADIFLMDPRTLQDEETALVEEAVRTLLRSLGQDMDHDPQNA
jgi:L-seryl-tRNA(Ser) seleniumtransferase